MYGLGLSFTGHDFIKSPIETEYGIKAKPSSSGNQNYNVISERTHLFLGNLVWKYNKKTHRDMRTTHGWEYLQLHNLQLSLQKIY